MDSLELTCWCDKCFSSWYWGLEGGQNKTSSCFPLMVILLLAWSVTVIPWPNLHKRCTIMEVDWRAHFLGDLIINCCLSGKLVRVQILRIPVTLQTDWRLSDSGCCGVLSVASVFHASWWAQSGDLSQALRELLTCADTLKNHYLELSLPLMATHSIQRHIREFRLNCSHFVHYSIV